MSFIEKENKIFINFSKNKK